MVQGKGTGTILGGAVHPRQALLAERGCVYHHLELEVGKAMSKIRIQRLVRLWSSSCRPEALEDESFLEEYRRMGFLLTSLVWHDEHSTIVNFGYLKARPIECLGQWTKRAWKDRLPGNHRCETFR